MRIQCLGALLVMSAATAGAEESNEPPPRADIWDVEIGMTVTEMPAVDFIEVSCGTNGGPPSLSLNGFEEFRRCKPEDTGLYEVTFRYDDELEYWARANEYSTWIEYYAGTSLLDHPVILSILISEDDVIRGVRIVTDPRADARARQAAVRLKKQISGRFGPQPWDCIERAPEEGEKAARGLFIKELCQKPQATERADLHVMLWANWFHKAGQTMFDPHTGEQQPGYFESSTRIEIYDQAFAPSQSG